MKGRSIIRTDKLSF